MGMKLKLQSTAMTILFLSTTSLHAAQEKIKEPPAPLVTHDTDALQLLQGQWLCKKTFKGSLGFGMNAEVNMVEYNRIQGNQVFSQIHNYITVILTQGKKRIVGRATVLERGQEHIDQITNEMYLSRLTRLDDARWIEVDDNKVGQFIHDDYFPFLEKLAKEELAEGTLRITHIDQLTAQQWRYHDDTDVPAYADCHRLDDTPLTPKRL